MARNTNEVEPTEQQEWEAKLTQVARDADKAQWEIGDLIIEADSKWGDMYTRAMEITGKPTKTLKNYVTVCKKFERSRRRDESDHLRFGHFAAVAGLDEPQQEKFLAKADKDEWSVDLIRLKVSELHKGSDVDPKERIVVMVPRGLYPAFLYREGQAPWWELTDDLSLLGRMARYDPLPDLDRLILNTMDTVEELAVLMVELASFDELRYEALLHAWPPGPNADPPPEEGFDPALFTPKRWDEVEEAMRAIYATGITHRPSFVNVIAEEAYAAGLTQMGRANAQD